MPPLLVSDASFRISSPDIAAIAIVGDYFFTNLHRGKSIFGILCITVFRVW